MKLSQELSKSTSTENPTPHPEKFLLKLLPATPNNNIGSNSGYKLHKSAKALSPFSLSNCVWVRKFDNCVSIRAVSVFELGAVRIRSSETVFYQ